MSKFNKYVTFVLVLFCLIVFSSCILDIGNKYVYRTVKFETYGGTSIAQQTVINGCSVVRPVDPKIGSAEFVNWYTADGTVYDFATKVSSDFTLFAHWKNVLDTNSVSKVIDRTKNNEFEINASPIVGEKTKVFVPANAIEQNGTNSELIISTYSIEVSPLAFKITDDKENNLAVAGLDCKLIIDGEQVKAFKDGTKVVITTHIPKGLSSVKVIYNGTGTQPEVGGTDNLANIKETGSLTDEPLELGYEKETGKLRFATTHFSEFYVATNAEVVIVDEDDPTDVSAMTLAEFRNDVNAGNTYGGKTVQLLKDCDYTDVDWVPIGFRIYGGAFHEFDGIFDGNNKTVKVKNSDITCCDYFGFFGEVYNDDAENFYRIYDLNLEVDFKSSSTEMPYCVIGGLIAESYYKVGVKNVKVSGTINSNRVSGGIIGNVLNNDSEYGEVIIKDCTVDADISAFSVFDNDNWLACGGIVGQNNAKTSLTIEDCSYTGNISTDFTGHTTGASSYLGYAVSKGADDGGSEVTVINNLSIGESSSIVGYQNVTTHDYPFEGRNMYYSEGEKNAYTYTGTPNHDKELLGGYFYKCTIDGVVSGGSGQTHYPHGKSPE